MSDRDGEAKHPETQTSDHIGKSYKEWNEFASEVEKDDGEVREFLAHRKMFAIQNRMPSVGRRAILRRARAGIADGGDDKESKEELKRINEQKRRLYADF